ncbi:MAG: LysM peptidoglycan-binding domain-containing protein [Myxococcota bacterium]
MALSSVPSSSSTLTTRRAASPAKAAPAPAPTYVVKAGDTFGAIAASHDLSVAQLAKLNPQVKNLDVIHSGERLKLAARERALTRARAPQKTYTVRAGDTFSGVAAKFHLTVPQLAKLNPQVKNLNVIHVGERLRVRAGTTTQPGAPSTPSQPPAAPSIKPNGGIPNTSGKSTAQRFALYQQYVEKYGDAQSKKDLAAGKRVILALRQDTPMTADRAYRGSYDDRIVVLWKDRSGPHVQELAANTEPNRRWAIPANQSSKPVGRLADNQTVRYHRAWSTKFGYHLQPYGNPYAQRDENRNYRFDAGEKKYNGSWGGQLMYVHRAWSTDTGSQGCQTMEEGRFNTFWRALGSQQDFSYVLVNVTKR